MLVTTARELAERRAAITRSPDLQRLLARLRALALEAFGDRPIYLPPHKALLTQDGGSCPVDSARLAFDPLSPDLHRCPACGRSYPGERHHRYWIMWYQVWLSERAIHLALIGALDRDPAFVRRAWDVLDAYATRYREYPNSDNVLGPTRLFFSTYLESIWLCQVVIAASLLDLLPGKRPAVRRRVRAMVAESAAIIASYNERLSNRQVWNNAALIAAGRWLGKPALVHAAVDGPWGIRAQLAQGVSSDGNWYEGQNYHFFALRGFLLAAEFLRRGGPDLYATTRLPDMYGGPLRVILPDLTLPARSDSPFGVSLLQPRFAELWEIGRARSPDQRTTDLLVSLYQADAPSPTESGLADTAEQEQNRPPSRLSRERLGWKALLWMDPEPPTGTAGGWEPASGLASDGGLAVMRPAPGRYVSLECGGDAGGHGHPDLLNLALSWDGSRLLDFGTGSYVRPSLHWYRSALCHDAPGLAGVGQLARNGHCTAFEAAGQWTWCQAVANGLVGPASTITRSVITGPDYVLDVVQVNAPAGVAVDLPLHPLGDIAFDGTVTGTNVSLDSELDAGIARGYDFAAPATRYAGAVGPVRVTRGGSTLVVHLCPRAGEEIFRTSALGPPDFYMADGKPQDFLLRRAAGPGRWVALYAPGDTDITAVEDDGQAIRVRRAGGTDVVQVANARVTIKTPATTVTLGGAQPAPSAPRLQPPPAPAPAIPCPLLHRMPPLGGWESAIPKSAHQRLGEAHYRRSEEPWSAGLSATVAPFACGTRVGFAMDVEREHLVVRAADQPNPRLDNNNPDVNSDGVQFYVASNGWQGFLVIPDVLGDPAGGSVRIQRVSGTTAAASLVEGEWAKTGTGYRLLVSFDLGTPVAPGTRIGANLVINLMPRGRQRRAGQLALAGGGGWVYLRGDTESPHNVVMLDIRRA